MSKFADKCNQASAEELKVMLDTVAEVRRQLKLVRKNLTENLPVSRDNYEFERNEAYRWAFRDFEREMLKRLKRMEEGK